MSKEARRRALEAICDAKGRTFLANAPLMAIVEAVQVLDAAGLLVDQDVADLDTDEPIPYTLTVQPTSAVPPAAAEEAKAVVERHAAANDWRTPCPVCGHGLEIDGECLNFFDCRNAGMPF